MDPEKQENSNSVEKARVAEDDLDIKSDNFRDAATTNPDSHFDAHDLDQVQRRLNQRHIQMYVSYVLHLNVQAISPSFLPLGSPYVQQTIHFEFSLRLTSPLIDCRDHWNWLVPRIGSCFGHSWTSRCTNGICSCRDGSILVRLLISLTGSLSLNEKVRYVPLARWQHGLQYPGPFLTMV